MESVKRPLSMGGGKLRLSFKAKRWLLIVHSVFAAILLGNMVAFLIFSITALAADHANLAQACYQAMHLLSRTSVRASTIGATLTGVLLSVWSNWGLFRYYWILAKEGLTLITLFLNLWAMQTWTAEALQLSPAEGAEAFVVHVELWTGILVQFLSLVLMYILSIMKPWGKRMKPTYK